MNLRQIRIIWVLAVNGYWLVRQIMELKPIFESEHPNVNIWFGGNTGSASPILIWEPVVLLVGIFLAFAAPKIATYVNCAYFLGVGGYVFYQYSQHMTTMAATTPQRSLTTGIIYIAIGLVTLAFGFESKSESKPVDISQHW